ncbi:MAG: DUF1080 domain-containing protein [Cyclobacteriaceae bacterium]|nr:DUF1080 domain-containing protein [Cyclobacteriaceae bacterium]
MRVFKFGSLLFLLGLFLFSNFTPSSDQKQSGKPLFNGKDLTGWDTYIGADYDTVQKKFSGIPQGLNHDPNGVFTIVMEDGKAAIRVSGQNFGGISTLQSFENYHLQLEFKWGALKWHPKRSAKRDSGLLYHAVGKHGADGGFWMRSQEFQIQEGDCGDYWGVAGGIADVPAVAQPEKRFVYTPGAPLLTFSENGPQGRNCIKNPDGEKPYGEWNTIDLYCVGDQSVHVVNGMVTMVLYNSRQLDGDRELPLQKGKIQLQSEGAELFYRNIWLEKITAIPQELLD